MVNTIKQEIKQLTNKIKETKIAYKQAQQFYSKQWYSGEFDSQTWYNNPEKYHQLEPTLKLIKKTQSDIIDLKHHFRIKHIVNSMCKGRSISQIENKVSENKEYERLNVYKTAQNILLKIGKNWIE